MQLQPHYIIPILIEQPTWGGQYIAQFKNLVSDYFLTNKIGQSYELSGANKLHTTVSLLNSYALGTADAPEKAVTQTEVDSVTMGHLIASDPERILGKKTLAMYGTNFPLLIKFTQAQENSYQLHVKPGQEFNNWRAKPESWYYLEQGRATLGIKDVTKVDQYKKRCQEINTFAESLSQQIKSQETYVEAAREKLQDFILMDHPNNYINTVTTAPGQIIDLSTGGVHHSWEADPASTHGNIVYEVQVDVMDAVSTLRSFDQGKMKDDGSIRPLTIDDYFTALDISEIANNPQTHMRTSSETNDNGATITALFNNKYYVTNKIVFTGNYQGTHTQLQDTFHHIFCLQGEVEIGWRDQSYPLPRGWSMFIPANCEKYELRSNTSAEILTSLPAC